jgi:hypothetical protein
VNFGWYYSELKRGPAKLVALKYYKNKVTRPGRHIHAANNRPHYLSPCHCTTDTCEQMSRCLMWYKVNQNWQKEVQSHFCWLNTETDHFMLQGTCNLCLCKESRMLALP